MSNASLDNLLKLIPVNKKKTITSKHCKKYYDLPTEIRTEIIHWKSGMNLNSEIYAKYKNKPDLWIICFDKEPILPMKNIPIYPIV